MTTTVTVTAGNLPAYVYMANLDTDGVGNYELTAELFEETRTFHVYQNRDLMVTETPFEEDIESQETQNPK
jgi:hypothetical protein